MEFYNVPIYVTTATIGIIKELECDGNEGAIKFRLVSQDLETMQPVIGDGIKKISEEDTASTKIEIYRMPKFFFPLDFEKGTHGLERCFSNYMPVGFINYIRDKDEPRIERQTATGFMKNIGLNALASLNPDITYSTMAASKYHVLATEYLNIVKAWRRSIITVADESSHEELFKIIITRYTLLNTRDELLNKYDDDNVNEFLNEFDKRNGPPDQVVLAFKEDTSEGYRRMVQKYLQHGITAYLEERTRQVLTCGNPNGIRFPKHHFYNSVLNQEVSPSEI